MSRPRVLILTASFGDGHNSAARGLAEGVSRVAGDTVRVEVRDFIREGQPRLGGFLASAYRQAITHLPWAWKQFYRIAEHLPLESDPAGVMRGVVKALSADLRRDPPAAIAATFPLYPPLIRRLLGPAAPPVHTVVTDSITIHPVWKCESVSRYFAADEWSAAVLRAMVGARAEVIDSGFPVDPIFGDLLVRPAGDHPRRLLCFPSASHSRVRRSLRSLLADGPADCELTVVLGRHGRRLSPVVEALRREFPGRLIDVLGWTTEVPRLMTGHDLIISKAGGATTHECGAAGRPVIITKVVPGQEEGNVKLVRRRGSGLHEENPEALGPLVRGLESTGAWLPLRDAAWRHRRADGATTIARHIVDLLPGAASDDGAASSHSP